MLRLVAVVLLVAGVALPASQRTAGDNPFPNTKPNGRATVVYTDDKVQAVAIYDYSQRNHRGAWLLVQTGVALRERGAIKRENFSLMTPDGRTVTRKVDDKKNIEGLSAGDQIDITYTRALLTEIQRAK